MMIFPGAVVPGYYLVCYNTPSAEKKRPIAVVPGYYLVCYNLCSKKDIYFSAVVPGYYLVCYNDIPTGTGEAWL